MVIKRYVWTSEGMKEATLNDELAGNFLVSGGDYAGLEAERDKWKERSRDMETMVLRLFVTLFPTYAYTGTEQALNVIERDFTSLKVERDRLLEALTPSEFTKAAYMGEFSFSATETADNGEQDTWIVFLPWTIVKEIMSAIRARAALAGEEKQG